MDNVINNNFHPCNKCYINSFLAWCMHIQEKFVYWILFRQPQFVLSSEFISLRSVIEVVAVKLNKEFYLVGKP